MRDSTWLHNPSFVPNLDSGELVSESSSSDYDSIPEPKKIKKKSSKKTEPASVELSSEKDVYHIDHKPDPENLHYDSVYSGKLAVYRRRFDCLGLRESQKLKWTDGRSRISKKRRKGVEEDTRYFTSGLKSTPSEVTIPKKTKIPGIDGLTDFVKIETSSAGSFNTDDSGELTAEAYMSKLTGEYNRSLLEHPHDVSLWLEFLVLQDQLLEWGHLPGETTENISRQNRALIERKNSIFERALEHNPMSEDLLVGHMTLVQEIWPNNKIVKKWKDIVFHQPNKPLLWLKYIHFCQTNFSSFGVSSVTSVYKKCIVTLSSILQGTLRSHQPVPDTLSYLLVIFSLFCDFLKQAGCVERAVACYQALIEFNLCTPSGVTEDIKTLKEFFEPFWNSDAPKFGEQGALGWCNWTKKNSNEKFDGVGLGLLPNKTDKSEKKGPVTEEKSHMTEEKDHVTEEKDRVTEETVEFDLISGLPVTEAWLKLEDYRMTHHLFPWQPNAGEGESEEDCTDPDRIVTFEDVSQTLFRIADQELKASLIISFLGFLGAPVDSPFKSLINVPLRLQAMSEVSSPLSSFLGGCGEEFSDCEIMPRGLGQTYSMAASLTASTLSGFAGSLSSHVLSNGNVSSSCLPPRAPDVCSFIANVCNHSLSLLSFPELQTKVVRVWFLSSFNQLIDDCRHSADKGTKKDLKAKIRPLQRTLKSFLRLEQHRNNLAVWNFYALLEYSAGNFKEAEKLYESLITQHAPPNPNLCCTMCECFMGLVETLCSETEIKTDIALRTLVCYAERGSNPPESPVSPARVLRARSYFSSIDFLALSGYSQVEMICVVLCCGYFECITRGVKEACDVFKKWEDALVLCAKDESGARKVALLRSLKMMYVKQLRLFAHHSTTPHPGQTSVQRRVIQQALEIFPDDCGFMSAFIKSEQPTFISGRLRRHFDRISPQAESVSPWIFAVVSELDRYFRVTGKYAGEVEVTTVGTVRRIMGLLNRAAASDNARHCPLLWRIYLSMQV